MNILENTHYISVHNPEFDIFLYAIYHPDSIVTIKQIDIFLIDIYVNI